MSTLKRPTEAWLDSNLSADGMGSLVVARFKANRDAEVGVFLLDTYCLGVKNAFFIRLTEWEYTHDLLARTFQMPPRSISPACARKLVEDAIAYTRSLGLEPHPDYRKGARVLGGIRSEECEETFTFGSKGKPLYVQGPHDSPAFVRHVLRTLTARLGKDGFHYLILGPGSARPFEDADPADSDDDGYR